MKKKPTLVLRLTKDNENFPDSYLDAIDSKLLRVETYKKDSFKEVVDEFVGYTKLEHGPKRYNVVLDRSHKYYLDWASAKYDKSRSEILRNALEDVIEEDDLYSSYLRVD